jgi:ABC-type transport system substrate-binding protein
LNKFLPAFLSLFLATGNFSASELRVSAGGEVTTIDPALAADFISSYMVCAIYDTLLEYDYTARPYRLKPSMLAEMPEVSSSMTVYKFKLRDDLFFTDDGFFKGKSMDDRKVRSKDVIYSFLRLADARLHSPGSWLWRGKIKGIDEFKAKTSPLANDDMSTYKNGCEGFTVIDDANFAITLERPDPRFLYALAMSYSGIVSYKAALSGNDFSETPAGSGPYIISEWSRDYKMVFLKNKDYRREFFVGAENHEDKQISLPFIDKITCYLVRQPLSSWLMFLKGGLDIGGIDKDSFDAVIDPGGKDIIPALKEMGINLVTTPEFQVNYVGFSFTDDRLAKNINLRKAMSLAYNIKSRIIHSNYALKEANGPIPPGVAGYDETHVNPYSQFDIEMAKKLLVEVGYPRGIDPKTGAALEFSFDLGDTSPYHRQIAELMVDDMKQIGIKINPILNNQPRFFQKLSEGQMQLFRISWVGDYPDAENFLQLFYSPNSGKCNRVFYKDKTFDSMFEKITPMPDSPERTKIYSEMSEYITSQCPWIFESYPVSYQLVHGWVENFIPHNFANARWKYLSINEKRKKELIEKFKPISLTR